MAANLTDRDEELIFALTTTIYTTFSITIVIPFLILTVLCIAALFLAKSINLQLRTLLINVFAVDLLIWIGYAIQYLGYPERVLSQSLVSCRLFTSVFIIIGQQGYMSRALYAVMVYFFIKDGVDPTKWRVIVPYIAISWVISISLGILAFFDLFLGYRDGIDSAFCNDSINLPPALALLITVAAAVLLSIAVIIIFSVLTLHYVKKNTLQGNVEVKRAVAKILLYHFVVTMLNLFILVLLSLNPLIESYLSNAVLVRVILRFYVLRIAMNLILLPLPIVILAVLKPLHQALKQVFLCCCVMKSNAVHPEV